ncbi:hypothetical protein [Streptomyces sp. Ru71]|uniref:hypothetical protein n=1 Tax=Streptomyces sp. Ru71 TaxID=2080746 RepID=UPI001CA505D5|nr:hypothetical protein [Streptomyces sp. Ru71]
MSLAGRTPLMSGGSRGIGLAIAVTAARRGANVIVGDVRDEAAVRRAVERGVDRFGGIDIVVDNASALAVDGTGMTTLTPGWAAEYADHGVAANCNIFVDPG